MGLLDLLISAEPGRRAGPLGRLLRPPACLACGVADAWPCCATCLRPEPAGPGPWRLAADPELTFWTLGLYQGALRNAVLAGKLRGQAAGLVALGRHLGVLMEVAGVGADLVTWVASRPARGLPRDHAKQIARGIAAAMDLPVLGLLAPAGGGDLGRARDARRNQTRGQIRRRDPPPSAACPAASRRRSHPARRRSRHQRRHPRRGGCRPLSGRRSPRRSRRPGRRPSRLRARPHSR